MKGFWYDNPVRVIFDQDDERRRLVRLVDAGGEDLIPPSVVGHDGVDDVYEYIAEALNALYDILGRAVLPPDALGPGHGGRTRAGGRE